MSKETIYDQHIPIQEELIGLHAINPMVNTSTSARALMMSAQLGNAKVLETGDTPIINVGMEEQLGDNTFSVKIPNDSKVVGVVKRYGGIASKVECSSPEMVVIFRDKVTGELDYVSIPTYHLLHQRCGFKYDINPDMVNCRPGVEIPGGTILADSPTVRTKGEYKYGVLGNMLLATGIANAGDGVRISESFSKRFRHKTYEKLTVNFGETTFPLNMYGVGDEYKSFPGVGEMVREDGILMAIRELDKNLVPGLTSKNDVKTTDPRFDKVIYALGSGKIVDIQAYHNPKAKKHVLMGTSEQTEDYVYGLTHFYKEIANIYDTLLKQHFRDHRNNDLPMSDRFYNLVTRALILTETEKSIKLTHKNDKLDLYRLEFTIEYDNKELVSGDKITTQHGAKGVIVEITPDHEMPCGADIVLDSHSVPRRMIVGCLYEGFLSEASRMGKRHVMAAIDKLGGLDKLTESDINNVFEIVLEFTSLLGNEQVKDYSLTNTTERLAILTEVYERELYIMFKVSNKEPVMSVVMNIIGTKFEPSREKGYVVRDGEFITTNKVMATIPQYFILLSMTGENFLATNSAKTNHFGVPVGPSGDKRNTVPWRDSPVKMLSETETRLYSSYGPSELLPELRDRSGSTDTHTMVCRGILEADTPTNIDTLVDRTKHPFGGDNILGLLENICKPTGIKIGYTPGKE